jgi:dTDP-4-amino-4,6-dideoxygalactose transaminase
MSNARKKSGGSGFPAWPQYDKKELAALLEVLRSRHWGRITGKKVEKFEKSFAKAHNAKYALACANGTAALEIALRALGVGPGDEVIVPAYTFIATATAVLQVGAIPVFVDIEDATYNIDAHCVEAAITSRTKAVIPVHFAGLCADMDALCRIARRYGLKLIEDCAQAHGAKWRGRRVGAIGDCGTFSFQETKNISAGEGGAIITDSRRIADLCFSYHHIGRKRGRPFYEHHYLAWNYRMTEFQAAILLAQLERLNRQTAHRERMAKYLSQLLSGIDGLRAPAPADARAKERAWHLYIMRYSPKGFGGMTRDEFAARLKAEGVPAMAGYPVPLYRHPLFAKNFGRECRAQIAMHKNRVDYSRLRLPVSERVCKETVWLPQYVLLGGERDMNRIAAAVRKIQRSAI